MAKSSKGISPKVIIIVVALVALVGAVAFFLTGGKDKMAGSMTGGNAITSIKDALTKSVSMECEYVDPSGASSKYYIKNGAIRAEVTDANPENSGSFILKEKKLYSWKGQEGFLMTIPDVKDAEGNTVDTQSNQADDLLKDLEEYKDKCKPSVVSDSLFNPPADVTFTDMSKMMDGSGGMTEAETQKMIQQYQDQSGNSYEEQPVMESTDEY